MNWGDLTARVQERTGLPKSTVKRVLDAMVEVAFESIRDGDSVLFKDLFTVKSRWRARRTMRSIADGHRFFMDGRFSVKLRPSARLKRALLARTPQLWRDAAHQEAWRVASTLVGDLDLYHRQRAPKNLSEDMSDEQVEQACAQSFGPLWARVKRTYENKISEEVRAQQSYLVLAAVQRWSSLS